MVAALPSVRNTTLEADPIHVLIARDMVAFSGMVQTCDVWTVHSKYLLPRLTKRQEQGQRQRYGALYMDRWGSEHHEDFDIIDRFSLIECSAAIVADQVLWTGASNYLWGLASRTSFSTRLVLVGVEDRATKRISGLSAHAVLGIIALHTARAQQTDSWELSGRRRRCQDLGAFMLTMKHTARAELRNIQLLVQTSLSLRRNARADARRACSTWA